jgi:ABC-type sugar transport system substrate-binding protein
VQAKSLSQLAITRAGVQIETVDCLGNAASQLQQVQQTSGVDFLLVFPIDLPLLRASLTQVKNSGTKVIVFDGAASPESCTTAIFCDESKVGFTAGDFVVKSLRKRAADEGFTSVMGRLVYLQDAGDGPALKRREEGFLKALARESGITLVHEAPVEASGADAAPRVAEAFRLQKDFDVIFCDTDLIANAASTAVTSVNAAARQSMLIMGVDGALGKGGGIELTVKSQIDATVWRPLLVDAAWAIIGKYLDDETFTAHPRYEQNPQPISMETALRFLHDGTPAPTLE